MKKIFIACLVCLALKSPAQLIIQNSGSTFRINGGAHLIVNGNLQVQAGGDFINNGVLALKGNFTNNQLMTGPGKGTLRFEGSSAQTIDGVQAVFAEDVVLDNPNGVTINTPLKVDGTFDFIDGIATTTDASPLFFTTNGTVGTTYPPADASHVNGPVVKEGTGDFTYPVGDGTAYQPVGTSLTSNTDGMRARYSAADAGTAAFGDGGSEAAALAAYNQKEYWEFTPLGSAAGSVTLFWDAYNPLVLTNISDVRVAHKNGGWLNEGGTGSGTTTNGQVTSNTVSTWSPFALGSITNALPVTLASFTGETEKENINQLTWVTTDEKDFSHFEVQHSTNALQFIALANIPGGTKNSYHYTHTIPSPGSNYYRLKMVDRDGTFAYSKMISLRNRGNSAAVYPNPAVEVASVTMGVNDTLLKSAATLYDAAGRTQQIIRITANQQQVDIRSLKTGVYILKFADGTAERFVKE